MAQLCSSSETQGQSIGSGEKAGRKFSSKSGGAPGYRLSPDHFRKFKRMPASDWAQKMHCIIVPNRKIVERGSIIKGDHMQIPGDHMQS